MSVIKNGFFFEKSTQKTANLDEIPYHSFSNLAVVTAIWSKKQKNSFSDKVNGSMCAKFQVCIVVSVARMRDTDK